LGLDIASALLPTYLGASYGGSKKEKKKGNRLHRRHEEQSTRSTRLEPFLYLSKRQNLLNKEKEAETRSFFGNGKDVRARARKIDWARQEK
jgi:hypothetical protein